MAFFVVGRSRNDGALRLLDSSVHDTREDAIRALQSRAESGSVDLDDLDVYVADLNTASLAVVVGVSAAPAQKADERAAGAWEAPAPAVVHELPVDDPGDLLLAGALQRAATHLESEGIRPPESVGFEAPAIVEDEVAPKPEPEIDFEPELIASDDQPSMAEPVIEEVPVLEDVAVPEVTEEVAEPLAVPSTEFSDAAEAPHFAPNDLSEVIASLGALDDNTPSVAEEVAGEAVSPNSTGWPWLNVDDVDVVALADDEGEDISPAVEAAAEPAAVFTDEDTLIPTDARTEGFTAQPVIMGDYAEDVVPARENVAEEPEVVAVAQEPEPVPAVIIDDLPLVPDPSSAYEPAGDLSLDAYTCADCIYSNTCPKVNQTTPSECGAFQWKAV